MDPICITDDETDEMMNLVLRKPSFLQERNEVSGELKGMKVSDNGIELTLQNGNTARFEDCWLRDHCRCSSCYHKDTYQRAKHILEIPDSKIIKARRNSSHLYIQWDDDHHSTYDIEFLSQFEYKTWQEGRKLKPLLWNGQDLAQNITKIPVDSFLETQEGASRVFQYLLDYGVALIGGVESTTEATSIVCKALGGIQHTLFGDMWEFTTRTDHADTAYTNLPLAVHNDNTYFTEAAGRPEWQIIKCNMTKNIRDIMAKAQKYDPFLSIMFPSHITGGTQMPIYCDTRVYDETDEMMNLVIRKPSFLQERNEVSGELKGMKVSDNGIELTLQNGNTARFEDCWLRDHCRCSSCYHKDTYQRAKHILEIPDSKIIKARRNSSHLYIQWDDDHHSTYDIEFLSQFEYKTWQERRKLKPLLWNGQDLAQNITKIPVDSFLETQEGASRVFQYLLDYGVALIGGVEPTTEATSIVCKALGGIQHTLFGDMWEFTTRTDHADTAYTNLPLAVHNDNTYFTEAAGLQVLHCLRHLNGAGGETILVDGFYGAHKLRREFPEDFHFLTKFHLEAEYVETGHHHKYSAPVIRVNGETNELEQIRFNVYDRAPMAFDDGSQCRAYYRSLRNLARYYQDPANQWQFKLTPGTVMVMDNFRVLHGRTGFTGHRVLSGCYVARSDWLDKARTLKLIQ